jgi:lysophospholipase L1-like esterase
VIPFMFAALLAAQDKPALPKVVLVGDSIRLGYAPLVAKRLAGVAEVISPPGAGSSRWLGDGLVSLVLDHKPDLVHFNAGLHDLRFDGKKHQEAIGDYEKNFGFILGALKETKATLIFANTTPIHDERHAKRKAAYARTEKDVLRYNAVAERVMGEWGVVVNDLHGLVHHYGAEKLLGPDGTHYTAAGNERLAAAVADSISRHLAIRAAKPGKPQGPSSKAVAEAYRKGQKERDALVPEAYRKMKFGELVLPKTADEWKKRRPEVLKIVKASLGELPERGKPSATLISREQHKHFTLESLLLPNGIDGEMTAYFLTPRNRKAASPAILWLHSSSYDRNQLLVRGYNGGDEPLGETYAKAGYAVLAPDACWYGGRAGAGPSGTAESNRTQQESLMKLHLWMGRTLWGLFVHDDLVALDYLCSRPEVDAKRIGATGISMGSTRAWWLAAVDERVACAVGVSCLTRYQNLIRHGELRQHGVYYYTSGLLRHFDSEGVISLIAPRPFLAMTGDLDAGSPADGVREIEARVGRVYETLGARGRFESVLYEDTGHVYTPDMRRRMLAWFGRWLRD